MTGRPTPERLTELRRLHDDYNHAPKSTIDELFTEIDALRDELSEEKLDHDVTSQLRDQAETDRDGLRDALAEALALAEDAASYNTYFSEKHGYHDDIARLRAWLPKATK